MTVVALMGFKWAVAFVAGFMAGAINVIVGAGTLVSFPLLVLLGYPPLGATIANTIGIVPGSASGVAVYRRELGAQRAAVRSLLPVSVGGGIAGALVLLWFPATVFTTVVPWLIALGTLLVVLGPWVRARVAGRDANSAIPTPGDDRRSAGASPSRVPAAFTSRSAHTVAVAGAFVLGVYGGYFGAAQGILLIGLLGVVSHLEIQELNAIKNLTVFAVNVIAAVVFIMVSPHLIDWPLAALVGAGAVCGGIVGGRFARRLSAPLLRAFVVAVGVITTIVMLLR